MDYRILGPLEVSDGDRPLGLGGEKQRALLAVLLLHAGEVVSADRLIDELWGERAPPGVANALQVQVSRLRKVLDRNGRGPPEANGGPSGPSPGGVLVTRGHGYLLRVEPGELDLDRFQVAVEVGRRALAAGDAQRAAGALRAGLELWRGPPLADFAYEAFAQAPIAQLEELRLGAVEDRVEADLALGDGGALVGELEGLVREHPLRERLRGQLMLALYRAGRQADALASYRELNGVLREELGLQPGESLRELEGAILRHDRSLLPAAAHASPPVAGQLPVPATPFLGRARELAEVTALLRGAGGRLVTLTGAGGSGKTRLALRAAQAHADEYVGGVWFVGFADLIDPGLIAPVICQALGLVEQPDLTPTQRLEGYLRDRELLLVLDSLEQLAPGVGVLGELLAACPGVRMLVTSREPLHLAGEQQYEVPVLEPGDAIELFTARAKTVAPGLIIERESVGAVCDRVDRLPLAIELAAARTKVLSPAEILHRLERSLPVLGSGPRDAPRRQRTLQATIDWSYELLTDDQQRLFARLSVFAGGCTLQAAEAVCDAELDRLGALVDRSLLRAAGGRYRMLQTLREYALDKLAQSGEEDHVRSRHGRWFVELLQAHGLDRSADVDTGKLRMLLEDERGNFRAALEWAQRTEEIETIARLAAPLTRLWREEGRLSEADRWIGVVRKRSADFPLALQAVVLSAARELAWARGERQEWADLCEQALAAYRELGDVAGIIRETSGRAGAAAELGDLPRARVEMEQALRVARDHELTGWLPSVLGNLADIEMAEGRLDQARALCEEALSLGPAVSRNTSAVVALQLCLAHLACLEHRYADAAELAQEVLERALSIRSRSGAAAAALRLGWSLAEREQPDRAARLLGAALEFYRHTRTAMQWSDTASERAINSALHAQLDERTLHTLLDEGRSMTVEQAVRQDREKTG